MKRSAWAGVVLGLAAGACAPLTDLGTRLGVDPGPIRLTDPIGPLTRARLVALDRDPAACRAWLEAEGVRFTPVADRTEGAFCRIEGAVALGDDLGGATLRLRPGRPTARCGLAAALAVWRRHSVEPAAREILGSGVSGIDHLGVYSCRRVNGAEAPSPASQGRMGRPSGHAEAAAIDVAGFRLADGRRVRVAGGWTGEGAEARFLRRVRDDACRVFGTALSPDYNARHADHLHLEIGAYGVCR